MGKGNDDYSPMVGLLADNLSKLNDIVNEKNIKDSAFFERMVSCQEKLIKTHHAVFMDNGESLVSKVKAHDNKFDAVEKQLARINKSMAENRKGDKDVKLAWIKVIGTIAGTILATLGTIYLAYLKLGGG